METFSGIENTRIEKEKKETNLSKTAVCFRTFKIGQFDEKSLGQFRKQIETIAKFKQELQAKLGDNAPAVEIITNSDLEEAGKQEISSAGLNAIFSEAAKAKRRSHLGKLFLGEKSSSKGDFSYSDMLNTPKASNVSAENYVYASSDLANKPEQLLMQIEGMKVIVDGDKDEKLAMIGSALETVHDMDLIGKTIDGSSEISLDNLSKVFPNNTLSLVAKGAKFSGIADNSLAGKIEIDGKPEPIGGNEDFLFGLEEMLYEDKDCILLIDPYVPGERKDEVKGVDSKYLRRAEVYKLYAERSVRQAAQRKKLDLGMAPEDITKEKVAKIIEDLMDRHLFFAKLGLGKKPEIILTARQRAKEIAVPTI